MTMPRVALLGKAGAGKTSLAEQLVERYAYKRLSFAQALRDCTTTIWGPGGARDRDKLQRLGVAVRDIDEDAWAKIVFRHIDDFAHSRAAFGLHVVVDDCRFPNEYYGLKERGFRFVRIDAPRLERVERLRLNGKLSDDPEWENHISELALDDLPSDGTIYNHSNGLRESWIQLDTLVQRWHQQ